MRKAMIVVQYTFSLMFIAVTIVGYNQYKSFLEFDLGYTTENILNIELQGNNGELLLKELKEMPEVSEISRSLMVTSVGSFYGGQIKYNSTQDSSRVWLNSIDENYLPLHGHKLLAGRNFRARTREISEKEVIINQRVMKRFDLGRGNPTQAIDEVVEVDGKKLTVIGVLGDFHYGTVQNEIEEVVFQYLPDEPIGYVNAKIVSKDWLATLSKINDAWKKIDRVHPLQATFYDDQIRDAYSEIFAMLKIVGFLAFLAVCISTLGLLGMVVYTTEVRLKEISIRKVLGASEGSLIYLLSKGFLILLMAASLVALPATFYLFDNILLSGIPYHAPIRLTELLMGFFVVGGIAFIVIGLQTLKVTRANPAEVLKNE